MGQRRTAARALACLALAACAGEPARDPRPLVVVSVLPQRYFAERIAGERVRVEVMIPPGASEASYEPTLQQIRDVGAASLYVKVGHPNFPFEKAWLDRLLATRSDLPVVDSSAGIDANAEDPHIWVAPRHARAMAQRMHAALVRLLPEHTAELDANLAGLLAEIDRVDAEIRALLADRRGAAFVVFHPAWGYFAREYGLVQLAIEHERKEPDPLHLARVIESARSRGVEVVFAQPQLDRRSAEVVAREIGARVEIIDPLAPDWPANLRRVARQLAAAARS